MKNVLFFIDTVYQLLSAYELKRGLFADDHVTVVLSKDTSSFAQIYKEKRLSECFDTVFYAEWPTVKEKYNIKSPFLLSGKKSEKILTEVYGAPIERQDICFIANRFPIVFVFLNVLKRKNPNLQMYEFDEGIDSYIHDRPRSPAGRWPKVIDKWFYFSKNGMYDGCYLLNPKLYTANTFSSVLPIPPISSDDRVSIQRINKVFDYPEGFSFPQKYVFLEEADDNVGNKEQYRGLIDEIIGLVGPENIVVKRHPRNTSQFGIEGVKELKTIAPWELFALNGALRGKVMISLASSTSYTTVFFSDYDLKSIVLHDVSNGLQNASMRSYGERVGAFSRKTQEHDERFIIPASRDELLTALEI